MIYIIWALIGNLIIISIDQTTKCLAVKSLAPNGSKGIINGVFELKYTQNTGISWGLFNGSGASLRWVFVALIITVLTAIYVYFFRMPKTKVHNWIRLSFVMISGGAVGNLIDRLMHADGHVTDFLYFSMIDFPIFNFADVFVVCGTALLAVLVLFFLKEGKKDA